MDNKQRAAIEERLKVWEETCDKAKDLIDDAPTFIAQKIKLLPEYLAKVRQLFDANRGFDDLPDILYIVGRINWIMGYATHWNMSRK